jgi:hypothetical protein
MQENNQVRYSVFLDPEKKVELGLVVMFELFDF